MSFRGRGRGGYNLNMTRLNGPNGPDLLPRAHIEILGWHGATPAECIGFIQRKTRVLVSDYYVDQASGILHGFVNGSDANELMNWNGVRFAGNPLKFAKSQAAANQFLLPNAYGSPMPQQNAPVSSQGTIQVLENFLKLRYDPASQLLNLSSPLSDPSLSSFFANPSTSSKFFPALMKIVSNLKLQVKSADLSNFGITDLSQISPLAATLPRLENLALSNNKISRIKNFEAWRKKLNYLRELVLIGNPILETNDPNQVLLIKKEIIQTFPRLVMLNGEVVRNEQLLQSNLSLPFGQPQPMFFQDPEVQSISTNFIANYYNLWDTNRQQLMVLYQNESQFSYLVDSPHPRAFDPIAPDFSYYIPQSRNLTRVSATAAKKAKLAIGQEQIFRAFSQLPKSQHELMSKPDDYSMEAYRLAPLGAICITLHGYFKETGPPENLELYKKGAKNRNSYKKNVPLSNKSFDRTFIVIPGPNNSMVVASDLLCIRPECDSAAFKPSATAPPPAPAQAAPAPGAPAVGIPPAAPGSSLSPQPPTQTPTPQPGVPTAADLPPEAKANLNTIQQELLVKVLLETRLNMQYGLMLCQQSNWDYQQCITNFQNSSSSLPPEAFSQ